MIILLGLDVELPKSLAKYPKVLSLGDTDCFERLTTMLMCKSGVVFESRGYISNGNDNVHSIW